jgi:Helicase associated domain
MVALEVALFLTMPPLARDCNTFIKMENNGMLNQMELCRAAYRNYVDLRESEGLPATTSRTPNDVWEQHMIDLAVFKERNGHCRVPRHYNENPKLGRWVMNVRSHFQFLQKGKKSSLITEERLQQLHGIEFDFAPKNKSHTKYYVDRWVHHLQELYEFKQNTGHCRVPQRYTANKKLGGWVLYVRHQYRKHQSGQPSTMTPDRIEQLRQLGFDFEPRKGRPGRSDSTSS